jgi:hypothetical protein
VSYLGHIALQLATNFAEDDKSQISFTTLDSPKVSPVQSAILSKAVLGKPEKFSFRPDPAAQSEKFNVIIFHTWNSTCHVPRRNPSGPG